MKKKKEHKKEQKKKGIDAYSVLYWIIAGFVAVVAIWLIYFFVYYICMGKWCDLGMERQWKNNPTPTVTIMATPELTPEVTMIPGEEAESTPVPTGTLVSDVTVTPEATKAPLAELTATPTASLTEIPVPTVGQETPGAATVTPEPSPENTPAIEPQGTATPIPSPTAMPVPTVAPTATPTPEPTSTPTPTPVVAEGAEALAKVQMGDKVWYEIYEGAEGNVLIVTGSGATWNFEGFESWQAIFKAVGTDPKATGIIVSEGITRIGDNALSGHNNATKVIIPDSLKEIGDYGFRRAGRYAETTTWVNLDLSKIDVASNAFYEANGLEAIEGSAFAMCTPTPTPTATPTPSPNPEKPREIGKTEERDYSTTTVEFWDDGSIYIKGTGTVTYTDSMYVGESLDPYKSKNVFNQVYFEEDITSVTWRTMNNILTYIKDEAGVEYFLPSTMDITTLDTIGSSTSDTDFGKLYNGDIVHGYYEGELVTLRFVGNKDAELLAKEHNATYKGNANYYMKEVNEILAGVAKTGTVTYTPEATLKESELSGKYVTADLTIVIEWE